MDQERPAPDRPPNVGAYEIRCHGEIDARWSTWFDAVSVRHPGDGSTVITGTFADQAALHGALQRLRDLSLTLISVTRLDDDQTPGDTP